MFFGDHPRGSAEFEPGGQAFVAAGHSGAQRARLEVSDLPASLSFDLDPMAQTLAYDASSVVSEVVAGYRNDVSGPTVAATVSGLPSSLDAAWTLGDQPSLGHLASAPIAGVELFAAAGPVQDLDPSADHYLSVGLTDVPAEANLTVDLSARHLQGSFSAPLGEAQAVARFAVGGRDLLATAELTGVPAPFDADFGDGTYRFRGLSGPLASASLAFTNHPGTTRPDGQHLAVGYRESTGDFDASMSLQNVSHVEYSRGLESQTFRLDADSGGAPVFLEADIVVSVDGVDDTVLAASARVDSLPATITVELADGKLTYGADRSVGLVAEIRVGKAAALAGLGAPLLAHGVAARARACDPGVCSGGGAACESFGRCLGVVGTVNLPGLPTTVVVDLEARTVALDGYLPPEDAFQVYLQLLGLIDDAAEIEGLVTLEGLPSPLALTAGPVGFDPDDPSVFGVEYDASASLGRITATGAATSTAFGQVRGIVVLADAPAQALVTGQFGSRSTVHAELSEPVATLDVGVTAELGGNPASGAVSLADVPATMDLVIEGFSADAEAGVPAISYTGSASTLDGFARVGADLIEAFDIGGYAVPAAGEAWFRVGDLGAETSVQVGPGNIVSADSSPATGSLQVGLSIDTAVPNLAIDVDPAFEKDLGPFGIRGALSGHVGAPEVRADLSVLVEDLQSLEIRPSEQISFLSTGLDGNYGRVVLDVDELFVRPDIDVTLQITASGAPDPPDIRFTVTEPVTSVAFRLADQSLRPSGCASLSAGVDLFHVDVATLPGPIATGTDRIQAMGGPLAHTVTALPLPVPLDIGPDLALVLTDVLTAYFTGPINDPPRRVDWGGGLGGC